MHAMEKVEKSGTAFAAGYKGRRDAGKAYHGLPRQGGNWKAHWGKLKRSAGYSESVKELDRERSEQIRRHNWKMEQIKKVQESRAIAGRRQAGFQDVEGVARQ